MSTRDMQWAKIDDFSPGIADDPGIQYAPGQAQRDSTHRCIANRDGALIPLPARTVPFTGPIEEALPVTGDGYFINGLFAPPYVILPSVLGINDDVNLVHELFVGTEWLYGGNHRQRLRRFRIFEDPGTNSDIIKNVTFADAALNLVPVGMTFGTTRVNRATPLNPGYPVVMALCPFGSVNSYLTQFPDETAAATNVPFDVTLGFVANFVCHQGRTIIDFISNYGQGQDAFMFGGEEIKYTPVNSSASLSTPASVWVAENASGITAMVAMSANELFALKYHGALYLQGDVADPIIVNLPMVIGSDFAIQPVVTSIGVVYVNRTSGVWTWQHGDTSKLLSPKLFGDFWRNTDDIFGNNGSFALSDEWILVPNNWLYDITGQAWWRIEDTDVVEVRNWTTFSDYIYGSIAGAYTSSSPNAIHRWVRDTPSNSYSWKSQPLWHTIDTDCTIREVTVRARGNGTITVTFTNERGNTDIQTFTVDDASNPRLQRGNIKLTGHAITVTLESIGTSPTDPAPTIFTVQYGYIENTHVATN